MKKFLEFCLVACVSWYGITTGCPAFGWKEPTEEVDKHFALDRELLEAHYIDFWETYKEYTSDRVFTDNEYKMLVDKNDEMLSVAKKYFDDYGEYYDSLKFTAEYDDKSYTMFSLEDYTKNKINTARKRYASTESGREDLIERNKQLTSESRSKLAVYNFEKDNREKCLKVSKRLYSYALLNVYDDKEVAFAQNLYSLTMTYFDGRVKIWLKYKEMAKSGRKVSKTELMELADREFDYDEILETLQEHIDYKNYEKKKQKNAINAAKRLSAEANAEWDDYNARENLKAQFGF